MAARLLHRRFSHALFRTRPQALAVKAAAAEPLCNRQQTHSGHNSLLRHLSTTLPQNTGVEPETLEVKSSLQTSARHDLAMVFTCSVCETRSVKTMSRESYEKGVVVARCGGCNNMHLIADRLGWFGDPSSVEDFLAERGEEIKKGSVDTLNLTPEDLAGIKSA